MTYKLPIKAIDYLLYNYPYLRREVESLDKSPGGIVMVPCRGVRRGSAVEVTAIERAELSMVLDAVERAWRSLTGDLKDIARAKYRRGMRHSEIERRYFLSRATLSRKLSTIRATVAGHLALVPEAILRHFWAQIR